MVGLSAHIESALDTVIEGLNWDIKLDIQLSDFKECQEYLGYKVNATTKGGYKYKGEIEDADDETISIAVFKQDPKTKDRVKSVKKLKLDNFKDITVYEDDSDLLKDDKMAAIIDSKVTSFDSARKLLDKWCNSPNAPSTEKIKHYVKEIINAGENAMGFLKDALSHGIDYQGLDKAKYAQAVKAKPLIMNAIFDIDSSMTQFKVQLETEQFDFLEKEFSVGYPEKFARGDFFPKKNYHKDWLEEDGTINICPFGTKGKKIKISELNIRLPRVPKDKSQVLFYDLPKEEQYWRRQEPPKGITPDSVEHFHEYIMEEYRRRREGVWFMNNGEPTYLTGNAYFALQWCEMLDNNEYMAFRQSQLEMFYHLEACIIDKRCFGQIFLKSRRTGFTYIVLAILMNMATSTKNGKYGMTSKTGTDVEEVWEKFKYMFLTLPFWLRPIVRDKEDSNTNFYFGKPSDNSKEAKKRRTNDISEFLNTAIDYRTTKNGSYDSVKLNGYLGDEAGKWEKPNDYITHIGIIRPTMVPSGRVVGKAFIGSTMGAMEKGGSQFRDLIELSQLKDRDDITKQTPSGLYFHFLAAQDNMEEYTDIYGKCWTEKPPKGTLNVLGEPILEGSLDKLIATEEQLRRSGKDKALNEQFRTYPRTIEHALRDETDQCVFNMNKLYEQLEHNATLDDASLYQVGNFEWIDGIKDGPVEFVPRDDGRFKVAWIPSVADGTEHMKNRIQIINGKFFPLNKDVLRFGVDPFTLASTHGEGSKGALHGKTLMFPAGGAPSNKFVVEYLCRTSDTVFFEDVIKCLKFYGAPALIESNRVDLLRHMRNRGYRGFAMDRVDRPAHKLNENEQKYGGQMMSGQDMLDSHMNAIGSWIEKYVGIYSDEDKKLRPIGEMGDMPFNDTINDWLAFDPKKRTKYDATISSGLAIMACQTEKYKGKREKVDKDIFRNLVRKYSNKGDIGQIVR
jgi:hypothetical protein